MLRRSIRVQQATPRDVRKHIWPSLSYNPDPHSQEKKDTTMRSSVSTATVPPQKPAKRNLTVKAEQQHENAGPTPPNDYDRFFWTYTEEPHRTRRMAIIKAHPEVLPSSQPHRPHWLTLCTQVTKLCGPEPLTKYLVALVVGLQILCAYLLRNTPFLSWKFLGTAYVVGATANQNLFLAIHEISHNLAFRKAWMNRALAIVANLPIGIPYCASFRVRFTYPPPS